MFWVTALCSFVVCVLFFILYGWSDITCSWPPCISELIEVHKTLIILFFGFSCGMVWFNMVLISLLRQNETMVKLSTVIYFAFMGILSFDVSKYAMYHYVFVALYICSSCWFVNLGALPENAEATIAVNVMSCLFVVVAVARFLQTKTSTSFKYAYTLIECLWVASLFGYTLVNSCMYRRDFGKLLINTTFTHN